MSILETINSPEDVKRLTHDEALILCRELREFLVENVSKTGGHLSSNLGAVELTVAIHRVYDTASDRVIFDVGHQSYVHKILTGRRDDFPTLRSLGGLSGFQTPGESIHDAFVTGHASNSVSAALGMARARSLLAHDYKVAAVIGDGSLTGGLAYEGLSAAAESKEPLLILLNDNGMSISKSVGGTERLLSRLRLKPSYIRFKRFYRRLTKHIHPFYVFTHNVKEWLKSKLMTSNMFSDMGLYYLGPVDGHDLAHLEDILTWASELAFPTLLHIVTQKGHGYPPAELRPDDYHSVSPFDPAVGITPCKQNTFSDVFGEELCRLAADEPRVVALTAAMRDGTGLTGFADAFPKRFYDMGITEGHTVTFAAGLAKQGAIPVFAVYSTFLQRSFDMLIHDVSLSALHCVFAVDRAGLVGTDGVTHHGVFDLAYLGCVPGITILCPATLRELRSMLRAAVFDIPGPVALRYPRGGEGKRLISADYRAPTASDFAPRDAAQKLYPMTELLREGADVTLITYGVMTNEAIEAADILAKRGISAEIVKLAQVCPLHTDEVLASLRKTGRLICAEDVCDAGCIGRRVLSVCGENGVALSAARLLNLGDGIVPHGTVQELLRLRGIDAAAIADSASELCV